MRASASPSEIALDTLATTLRPLVKVALDANSGAGWRLMEKWQRDRREDIYSPNLSDWCPEELCQRIVRHWDIFFPHLSKVFEGYFVRLGIRNFDYMTKNWFGEIDKLRNSWAHLKPGYTLDQEIIFLTTAAKILSALQATTASDSITKIRRELERGLDQPWTAIVALAKSSTAIQLLRTSAATGRSLGAPLPQYFYGEQVKLRFDPAQEHRAAGFPFAWVLVKDSEVVTCLCPSTLAPQNKLGADALTIPAATSIDPAMAFRGARGLHTIYLLLTKTELSRDVYSLVTEPRRHQVLDEIARCLKSVPVESFRLFQSEFEVV